MEQPCYEKIDNVKAPLLQGDIVFNCPVIRPPEQISEGATLEVKADIFDIVVLSQSCDLEQGHLTYVLVCPIFDFQEIVKGFKSDDKKRDRIERRFKDMRSGTQPGYHMLDKNPKLGVFDYKIADLRSVHGVHINSLRAHIDSGAKRVRLLSPYREHLAQAFARFMMRVGLPQNIADLTKEEAQAYVEAANPRI